MVLNNMNHEDDRRGEFISRKYMEREYVNKPFPKARGTTRVRGMHLHGGKGGDTRMASTNARHVLGRSTKKRPLNRQSLPVRKQSQGKLDSKSALRAHRGKSYSGPVVTCTLKSKASSSSKVNSNSTASLQNSMPAPAVSIGQESQQSNNKVVSISSAIPAPPRLGHRLSDSASRLLQKSQIQSAVRPSRMSTFFVSGKRQSRQAASTTRSKGEADVRVSSRSSLNSQRAVLASF